VIVALSNLQAGPYRRFSIEVQKRVWAFRVLLDDMMLACSSARWLAGRGEFGGKRHCPRGAWCVSLDKSVSATENFGDRNSTLFLGRCLHRYSVAKRKDAGVARPPAFEILGTNLKTLYSNAHPQQFRFLNRADDSRLLVS